MGKRWLRITMSLALGLAASCKDTDPHQAAITPAPKELPFIAQESSKDCGVAAMAMTLRVYGQPADLVTIKQAMKGRGLDADANGLSALDLKSFAERRGLSVRGVKMDARDVGMLVAGDILWFGFDHFVVFDRMEGERVRIADPAIGRRTLDPVQFAAEYSGVALVFAANTEGLRGPPGGDPSR